MAPLAVPLLLAGTAVSAYGQYQSGKAAAQEQNYNALLQEREAKATEQKTRLEQQRQAESASRQRAELASKLSASGAVTTAGAPLMIMSEQAIEHDIESQMIGYEGREAAAASRAGAAMSRIKAKNARTAGNIGAGSTLLHGFGSAMTYAK